MTRAEVVDVIDGLSAILEVSTPGLRWAKNTRNGRYFPKSWVNRNGGNRKAFLSLGPNLWRGGGSWQDFIGIVLHEFAHHVHREREALLRPGYYAYRPSPSHGALFFKALRDVIRAHYGKGNEWKFAWHLDYANVWKHGRLYGWTLVPHFKAKRLSNSDFLKSHREYLVARGAPEPKEEKHAK